MYLAMRPTQFSHHKAHSIGGSVAAHTAFPRLLTVLPAAVPVSRKRHTRSLDEGIGMVKKRRTTPPLPPYEHAALNRARSVLPTRVPLSPVLLPAVVPGLSPVKAAAEPVVRQAVPPAVQASPLGLPPTTPHTSRQVSAGAPQLVPAVLPSFSSSLSGYVNRYKNMALTPSVSLEYCDTYTPMDSNWRHAMKESLPENLAPVPRPSTPIRVSTPPPVSSIDRLAAQLLSDMLQSVLNYPYEHGVAAMTPPQELTSPQLYHYFEDSGYGRGNGHAYGNGGGHYVNVLPTMPKRNPPPALTDDELRERRSAEEKRHFFGGQLGYYTSPRRHEREIVRYNYPVAPMPCAAHSVGRLVPVRELLVTPQASPSPEPSRMTLPSISTIGMGQYSGVSAPVVAPVVPVVSAAPVAPAVPAAAVPMASAPPLHPAHHPTTFVKAPVSPKRNPLPTRLPGVKRHCILCGLDQLPCWRPLWLAAAGQLCNLCGLRYKKTGARCLNQHCGRIPAKGEWTTMQKRGRCVWLVASLRWCYKCLHCDGEVEVGGKA